MQWNTPICQPGHLSNHQSDRLFDSPSDHLSNRQPSWLSNNQSSIVSLVTCSIISLIACLIVLLIICLITSLVACLTSLIIHPTVSLVTCPTINLVARSIVRLIVYLIAKPSHLSNNQSDHPSNHRLSDNQSGSPSNSQLFNYQVNDQDLHEQIITNQQQPSGSPSSAADGTTLDNLLPALLQLNKSPHYLYSGNDFDESMECLANGASLDVVLKILNNQHSRYPSVKVAVDCDKNSGLSNKRLKVCRCNEPAVDTGGVRRETYTTVFTEFIYNDHIHLFDGPTNHLRPHYSQDQAFS